MRGVTQGLVLFLVLFLTGVDTKAAETGKDLTPASAWSNQWIIETKTVIGSKHSCDEDSQGRVYGQVYLFIQKASLEPFMWKIDQVSFQRAVSFLKSVSNDEIKQCRDVNKKWAYLLRISDELVEYIKE